jgi:hypothetical protein
LPLFGIAASIITFLVAVSLSIGLITLLRERS